MMNNGGLNPRHPSLDNLRMNKLHGSRSHPQLPGETSERMPRGKVRFEDSEHDGESVLEIILDVFSGIAAFVCSMGLVTVLILLYLIVRPFSVGVARRLSASLGAAAFLDAIAVLLPNTRIYLTGDSDIPSPVGASVLVSNHLVDGDWYSLLMLGRCVGLRGSVKVFLRNEILNLEQNGSPRNTASNIARRNSPPPISRPSLPSTVTGIIDSIPAIARSSSNTGSSSRHPTSPDLSMAAAILHTFLDFPLMNGEDYISNRENMFQLLRSFSDRTGAGAPVHLLLFPEGWSVYNGEDRQSVLARSNAFAKREGRPQLKHLLLPRTTGFNASLDSLRDSSPVVYDVTMAYRGYDGSLPPKMELSLISLWSLLRRKYPEEMHVRIKRYSMEEVLQDTTWLDKKWAEKDRLLHHFSRHSAFPADSRGFARHRVFDTRYHSVETSFVSLARMLLIPCTVPVLMFLSIPILWTVFWAWLLYTAFKYVFGDSNIPKTSSSTAATPRGGTDQTPIIHSGNPGTPYTPATPFASPLFSSWRDMMGGEGKSS
jgi:Acyltransferase C-terminus